MDRVPFNQLIQDILRIDDVEISKIEYIRESDVLSILLKANYMIPHHNIDMLKTNLKTHLGFIENFEIDVELIEPEASSTEALSSTIELKSIVHDTTTDIRHNWDNILNVVRRKNPAVASILRRSKISFDNNAIHIVFEDKGLENTFFKFKTDEMIHTICETNLNQKFPLTTESLRDEIEGLEAFDREQVEAIESIVATATNGFNEESIKQVTRNEENVRASKITSEDVLFRNRIKRAITKIIEDRKSVV